MNPLPTQSRFDYLILLKQPGVCIRVRIVEQAWPGGSVGSEKTRQVDEVYHATYCQYQKLRGLKWALMERRKPDDQTEIKTIEQDDCSSNTYIYTCKRTTSELLTWGKRRLAK